MVNLKINYLSFVDGQRLLLPASLTDLDNYFSLLTFYKGRPGVIPCLPTYSKASVTLWKGHIEPELIPLNGNIEYDPTKGFKIKIFTDDFLGAFECIAEYQNKVTRLELHIDILRMYFSYCFLGMLLSIDL